MSDLIIALREEIGNPDLFTGRKAELAWLLKWCEGTKKQYSKSKAILARRKKGKTALLQRLFNILYSNNDPQVVPFYFRVKEDRKNIPDFAHLFYRALMSQLLGFQLRDPDLINNVLSLKECKRLAKNDPVLLLDIETMEDTLATAPNLAWDHARDAALRIAAIKDIRII